MLEKVRRTLWNLVRKSFTFKEIVSLRLTLIILL
jgi:hypothetical protein